MSSLREATADALRSELFEALAAPAGRLYTAPDGAAARLRNALYRARASIADAALESLQMRLLSEDELLITKAALPARTQTPLQEGDL